MELSFLQVHVPVHQKPLHEQEEQPPEVASHPFTEQSAVSEQVASQVWAANSFWPLGPRTSKNWREIFTPLGVIVV